MRHWKSIALALILFFAYLATIENRATTKSTDEISTPRIQTSQSNYYSEAGASSRDDLKAQPKHSSNSASPEKARASYASATNISTFIHHSLQEPQNGGRFYAAFAFSRCQEVSSLKKAEFDDEPKWASSLVSREVQRCGDVLLQYPQGIANLALQKDGLRDPLILEVTRGQAVDSQQQMRTAYATNDKNLISSTLDFNFENIEPFIFENSSNSPKEKHFRRLALSVALCKFRGDCKDSLLTAIPCVRDGLCERRGYEYLVESWIEIGLVSKFRSEVAMIGDYLNSYQSGLSQ